MSILLLASLLFSTVSRAAIEKLELRKCDGGPACQHRCAACVPTDGARPFKDQLDCLIKDKPDPSCATEVVISEWWKISHYCVASDSFLGGWGFRIPLAQFLVPSKVLSARFEATLVPTTGDHDILQEDSVKAAMALAVDLSDNPKQSMIRTCKLSAKDGYTGLIEVIQDAAGDAESLNSTVSRPIRFNADSPTFAGDEAVYGDKLVVEIITDAQKIANNGVLPPALDYPKFYITHVLNF